MITLCTVASDTHRPFLDVMLASLLEQLTMVSEVLIANPKRKPDYYKEWETKGIRFCNFGSRPDFFIGISPGERSFQHAVSMHACIARATNEYLYLCDPDVFFYSAVDEFYFGLMEEYDLNLIGASHKDALSTALKYFPGPMNMMCRKSELPGPDFMKGKFRRKYLDNSEYISGCTHHKTVPLDWDDQYAKKCFLCGRIWDKDAGWVEESAEREYPGYWMFPAFISEEYTSKLPNPTGSLDVACYLYLWSEQQNWKWLAFQTWDAHNYDTRYFKGNVKVSRPPKQKLFYHQWHSTIWPEQLSDFQTAYDASQADQSTEI